MDLLDRLADQVNPTCGQVLRPEQGDSVGECGRAYGYHCGFSSATDRWAFWVLSLLPCHRWGGGSPQGLLITETFRLTGEPFGSHFKPVGLFQPRVIVPLLPYCPWE